MAGPRELIPSPDLFGEDEVLRMGIILQFQQSREPFGDSMEILGSKVDPALSKLLELPAGLENELRNKSTWTTSAQGSSAIPSSELTSTLKRRLAAKNVAEGHIHGIGESISNIGSKHTDLFLKTWECDEYQIDLWSTTDGIVRALILYEKKGMRSTR